MCKSIKGILIFCCIAVLSLSVNYQLNLDNFQEKVGCSYSNYLDCPKNKHRDWFIMFHAPWCGHCKNSKPKFIQFSQKYGQALGNEQKQLAVGFVDCTQNQNICRYFGVNGFPVFLYLPSNHLDAYAFSGARTSQNFQKFALNPQGSQLSKSHEIGYSFAGEIYKAALPYWKQIILFGFILPGIVGYVLAQIVTRWQIKKNKKKQLQKQKKLSEQQVQTLKQSKKQ